MSPSQNDHGECVGAAQVVTSPGALYWMLRIPALTAEATVNIWSQALGFVRTVGCEKPWKRKHIIWRVHVFHMQMNCIRAATRLKLRHRSTETTPFWAVWWSARRLPECNIQHPHHSHPSYQHSHRMSSLSFELSATYDDVLWSCCSYHFWWSCFAIKSCQFPFPFSYVY